MEPLLPFETRMELAIAEMSLEEKDSCNRAHSAPPSATQRNENFSAAINF